MNRLTKQYKDTKRYYSTHTCDEVLQKLGKLEDLEEVLEEYNVTLSNLREVLLVGQMFISKPTLEEVKKEWEDDGWRINDSSGFICFSKLNPRTNMNDVINFHPLRKILSMSFYGDENIDIKVLQRITKTTRALRALGWEV